MKLCTGILFWLLLDYVFLLLIHWSVVPHRLWSLPGKFQEQVRCEAGTGAICPHHTFCACHQERGKQQQQFWKASVKLYMKEMPIAFAMQYLYIIHICSDTQMISFELPNKMQSSLVRQWHIALLALLTACLLGYNIALHALSTSTCFIYRLPCGWKYSPTVVVHHHELECYLKRLDYYPQDQGQSGDYKSSKTDPCVEYEQHTQPFIVQLFCFFSLETFLNESWHLWTAQPFTPEYDMMIH